MSEQSGVVLKSYSIERATLGPVVHAGIAVLLGATTSTNTAEVCGI